MVDNILWGRTHKIDGREFLSHVFERMTAMVEAIINNLPKVMRGFAPDKCVYRFDTCRGIVCIAQSVKIPLTVD